MNKISEISGNLIKKLNEVWKHNVPEHQRAEKIFKDVYDMFETMKEKQIIPNVVDEVKDFYNECKPYENMNADEYRSHYADEVEKVTKGKRLTEKLDKYL